jgi:hypothetical protein
MILKDDFERDVWTSAFAAYCIMHPSDPRAAQQAADHAVNVFRLVVDDIGYDFLETTKDLGNT